MNRSAGILMAVTSLPSKYGIGCFSKEAYDFVDYLVGAGQTYWQILPLGPTSYGKSGDSPYQSYSAFAGNPYMISLEDLIEEGWLTGKECDAEDMDGSDGKVDFEKLHNSRLKLLRKAYERSLIYKKEDYQKFLAENGWWLNDYALFMALRVYFGDKEWSTWPQDIRLHREDAVSHYHRELYFDVEFYKFMQYEFFSQWGKLKNYANKNNIRIVGDMPIYVSMESSDVWANPELFQLDEDNVPLSISGCPPDAFAVDGQIWNNPLYRWDYHRQTGFIWWIARIAQSFRMFDVVRIDHFRGFEAYFSIPADSKTALTGHWEKGPGMDLFREMKRRLGDKQVIAEDLGLLTEEVRQLVRESGFPNMKVLEFGFDQNDYGASNDYLPHNYPEHCVAYTGTHDNETCEGWFLGLDAAGKQLVRNYLCDQYTPDSEMYKPLICTAMMSRAETCIIPIQDYLGLGNDCRMNQPATTSGNWSWRLPAELLTKNVQKEILSVTMRYGRYNWANYKNKENE